jgi:hypothetical protein
VYQMLVHQFIKIISRSGHVRFVVDEVVLGQVARSGSVLLCQYHSSSDPYSSEDGREKPGNLEIGPCCCGNLKKLERNVLHVFIYLLLCGLGSSVSIATDYGLDGLGIESRWGRDFLHTSRPALGPTQPPVQWVPGLSQG